MKFLKNRVLRIGIKVLIYLHLWQKSIKITFSIPKINLMTIFTLINSSACFFYENLLTLLVSKPLLWKDGSFTWKDWWLLLLFSFLHVSHFWSLSDGGGEEIIRWLATEVWQYFHNNIYVSGPILVKLANELNPSCLSPTFVKKFFQ